MGGDVDSFGTAANTSHCKSPAGSREPQRVLCVHVVSSGGRPEPPWCSTKTAYRLPIQSISISQPITSSLKIKKLGECSPLPTDSGSRRPPPQTDQRQG
ncbi:hypothetical protein PBY51_020643 [Eleginops maclovinus]|uniref:Uncharacterized protein n=1 Tax=Eleginops maclovinus TaxID=56733 RepID=A0AAN7XSB3_ELEMC|nr:hypothetical protein PBY51_020643 [Eleginops maclovinus]